MIRTIRILGIVAMALAATSALAVSAQASELHATVGPNASLTGQQVPNTPITFRYTGSGVETRCAQAHFEGTIQGQNPAQTTAQEFTLTPTFTGCQVLGLASTVDMNGCKFTFTNKQTTGLTAPLTSYVDIAGCTVGQRIEHTLPGCTITIPEQNHLSHVAFQNTGGAPHDVDLNFTIQGMTYEFHGPACPGANTVLTNDGDITGKVTLQAYFDNGSFVAFHNGHQYNKLLLGPPVGLFAT
jgi:hypothetical protein